MKSGRLKPDVCVRKLVSPMMLCRIAVYVKSDGKMYGGIIDEVMQKAFADTEVILKQVIK